LLKIGNLNNPSISASGSALTPLVNGEGVIYNPIASISRSVIANFILSGGTTLSPNIVTMLVLSLSTINGSGQVLNPSIESSINIISSTLLSSSSINDPIIISQGATIIIPAEMLTAIGMISSPEIIKLFTELFNAIVLGSVSSFEERTPKLVSDSSFKKTTPDKPRISGSFTKL